MPVPLIVWGIAAGATALLGAGATAAKTYGEYQRGHGLIYTTLQDWGLAPPTPTPTAPPTPAAPRTAAEMKTWTPAILAERDAARFRQWAREGVFSDPKDPNDPTKPAASDQLLLAAIAIGGLALLLTLGGRRR